MVRGESQCSSFLRVMLLWHAAFGGALAASDTCPASSHTRSKLDEEWSFIGEVNNLRAYLRPNRAVCLVPWDDGLRVFAGSSWRQELDDIA